MADKKLIKRTTTVTTEELVDRDALQGADDLEGVTVEEDDTDDDAPTAPARRHRR